MNGKVFINSNIFIYGYLNNNGVKKSITVDCLMLAAAILNGCKLIFSEDMQDGQKIGDLEIVNIFQCSNFFKSLNINIFQQI